MKLPKMPMPIQTGAAAVYPYSTKIEKAFTLMSRYEDTFKMYKVVPNQGTPLILLPREVCPTAEGLNDKRVSGPKVSFMVKFKARNHEQDRVVKEAVDLLRAGRSFITQAPTGFGKTVVTAAIIGHVGVKTLVIVPKNDITKQWADALKMVLGLTDDDIGYIQGDTCSVANKKVCIAMVHSVCKSGRYPAWVYRDFGFIVIDETHVMGAETFADAMWMFPAKLRMGLSATPYRKDGRDIVFFSHIGQVEVKAHTMTLLPKVLIAKSAWKCPVVKRKQPNGDWKVEKLPHGSGKTMHINKLLASDMNRNNIICSFIKTAYDKGRSIIVFSDLKEFHLDRLYAMCQSKGIPAKSMAYYVGGMKEKDREAAKIRPVIFATYAMCSMATDIPWLDTAVLCTPRSDVVQIVGRILRESPDKKEPVVFDIVDDDSPVFKGYAERRFDWYRKIKAKVVRVD